MKEIVTSQTAKHIYADDVELSQKEPLEAIQSYFKQFGTCIIQGCELTPNGSNFDIGAGLVAVEHADGFKVARFAAVTNKALPGHITITKSTKNGNHGLTPSYTSAVVENIYTATWNDGAPGIVSGETLIINNPNTSYQNDFISRLAIAATTTSTIRQLTVFDTSDSLKFWANRIARTLHVQGDITINNFSGGTVLGDNNYPLFQTPLPESLRPATTQHFLATVISSSSFAFKDKNQSDYIRTVTGIIETNGNVFLRWIRPQSSITTYDLKINAVLQLD